MSNQSRSAAGQKRNSVATDMELRRRLLSCMAETLTSAQYQVCVLNLLEGMPQKDIASEFGLSRSAVSRTISAAKYRLRRALGYSFEPADPMEDFLEED